MTWYALDTWIVVIAVLCAASCALLGNFLVLRRMSMMGDAISHAVLPGLAVAFLVTGSRTSLAMFVGAAVVGVLTAMFVQWVHGFGRVDRGASMGVVFTTLFAVGLVLIVKAAHKVDLDPGCVLYGSIELAPMDRVDVLGFSIPRAALVLATVFTINAVVVIVLFKEFKITSFDPALATTLGINASVIHYLLMTMVAVTTVAAFEAVGSILVIAMLIVPAAAAHLLTDRLGPMIAVSLIFAAVTAVVGHVAAITVPTWFGYRDTMTAGMIAAVGGGLFTITLIVAPRHGVLSRFMTRSALRHRILREDVLGLLYRLEERGIDSAIPTFVTRVRGSLGTSALTTRYAIRRLLRQGLVELRAGVLHLTDPGRDSAVAIVRAHRLWETYLVSNLAVPADHVHGTAMDLEHITGDALREALAEHTDDPEVDPHGREIPREAPK